jgi:hypothetical protein
MRRSLSHASERWSAKSRSSGRSSSGTAARIFPAANRRRSPHRLQSAIVRS